mgnify:CR=1 FL=1
MSYRTCRRVVGPAVVVAALVLAGCGSDDVADDEADADTDTIRLWIEPELVDCEGGAGPQQCLVVARSDGGEPELFYDSIEGFEFEEGTGYVVDVSVTEVADPPADGSSLQYTLVEVVEPDG